MRYAESTEELVVVDAPRNRFKLLVVIPTAADPTRTALLTNVVKHVRFWFAKEGLPDPGAFNPAAISPDVNGWLVIP